MKAVVTGGFGFIGSHLVDRLVRSGCEVHVLDNMHTGRVENLRLSRDRAILHRGPSSNISVIGVKAADVIFHLGMYSSSPMYREDPGLVAKVVEDAVAICEYARREGSKLVVASTSSIYNGNGIPWKEGMPIWVTDYYCEARYAVERMAELYSRLHGVDCTVLRLFSVYGDREEGKGRYANTLTQFLWSAMRGERPLLYGDGTQSRDLVYVQDAVDAFLRAGEKCDGFEVYNVGTGVRTSFNDMLKLIGSKLLREVQPRYVRMDLSNYVMHTQADTEKAERELGFRPSVDVERGVELLVEYYAGLQEVPRAEG
jgi:UDP-glucose 4-epimerase